MKLSAAATRRFLKNPDPAISIVLLYGPDHGLIVKRAEVLERHHLGDNAGPFSQTTITSSGIKNDPASLHDGFCALALGGGPRIVRLRASTDQATPALKDLLQSLNNNEIIPAALLVIEAGDLTPRSTMRKLIEGDKTHAAALACYAPGPADLQALAEDHARQNGLHYDVGALDFLVAKLPQDRALARSGINKLMLYGANSDGGVITIADINAVLTDSIDQTLDAFGFAVADGPFKEADRLLTGAQEAGQSPIALLRSLQRLFMRLNEAKTAIDGGADTKSAMASLRPPVFFAHQQRFSRALGAWSAPALRRVLQHCLNTERAMKGSGSRPENLLARLVIKVCVGSRH